LLDLCEQFSLKFIVIADRFCTPFATTESAPLKVPKKRDKKAMDKQACKLNKLCRKERTVDEIKERYYSVAKAVLEGRG